MSPREFSKAYAKDDRLFNGRFFSSGPLNVGSGDRIGIVLLVPGAPEDLFLQYGAEGQIIAGIPSLRLVVVRTGRSDGKWIEVVEGLESGDRIIYDGQFALEDGSIVDIDESVAAADIAPAAAVE